MPLGWIDFSKSDRAKVLDVLDMLSEKGILDELGIAPVRDGFAKIFFPGTSTVQTRAKYFFIVPYHMIELEHSGITDVRTLLRKLSENERKCAEKLIANSEPNAHIIGSRSLNQKNKWVKRAPSDIYWAGLRSYGIFTQGEVSIAEYLSAMGKLRGDKKTVKHLGYRLSDDEDEECDDNNAGGLLSVQFWRVPTYCDEWMENISINLTPEEGEFLKKRIIQSYPDSLMSYILANNRTDILDIGSFLDLKDVIKSFPEQIRTDYLMAYDFSEFVYVLRVLYNVIISDEKNEEANNAWKEVKPYLKRISKADIDGIINRLELKKHIKLCGFLKRCQSRMAGKDIEGLKKEIIKQERELKTTRAKTNHIGEQKADIWYGGKHLHYRFANAKMIIRDIFESEDMYAQSRK